MGVANQVAGVCGGDKGGNGKGRRGKIREEEKE
jgi:hypothetical protein